MRALLLFPLLTLLLPGCIADPPVADPSDDQELADEDPADQVEPPPTDDDDATAEHAADDDDDADDDDATDDEPPQPDYSWAFPPETPGVGSTIEGTFVCGFFEGPAYRHFTFNGELWDETTPEDQASGVQMHEGTETCLSQGIEKYLDWYVDSDGIPFMYLSGGFHHDLTPAVTPDVWNGRVYPVDDPSDDCLAALGRHGLSLPVILVFTIDAVEIVDSVPN